MAPEISGTWRRPVLAVLAGERLDIDDVAGFEHLRDLGRHLALDRPAARLRPLHALERHDADLALA